MSKGKLFEFAIICHPTSDEVKAGKTTEVLVNPKVIVAADDRSATILAGRAIPDTHLDKLDRIEVAVRPF